MKTWIISDTHFGHQNIVTFCGRPADNFDRLFMNMQNLVRSEDVLFHLGDVCFHTPEEDIARMLNQIQGRVYLVRGNHDKWTTTKYLNCGFAGVFDSVSVKGALLTHEPVFISGSTNLINIHGHLHNLGYNSRRTRGEEFDAFGGTYQCFDDGKHVLYAPELENYMPLQIETLIGRSRID